MFEFELYPLRKNLPLKAIYEFLKRNSYSFRTKTHYGQLLPDNYFYMTSFSFLNEVRNLRLEYAFNNASMGFTKTIAKKDTKQVIIQTQNKEKCLCIILLGITADGYKLTPMVIFKAKEYKTVYKKLLSDNNVIKGLIYVECNNNA